MDVQCERCKAEYEFDDALVSGRGTTVRCTACGHQFRLRPKGGTMPPGVEDRWTVVRIDGSQDVFTTLRDLQQAIVAKRVSKSDRLARGSGPARELGAIAELESFFRETGPEGTAPLPGAPSIPPKSNVAQAHAQTQAQFPVQSPRPSQAPSQGAESIHDARTTFIPRTPSPDVRGSQSGSSGQSSSGDRHPEPRAEPGTSYIPHQPGASRMSPLPPPPRRNSRKPSLQGSVDSQSQTPLPSPGGNARFASSDIESTYSDNGHIDELSIVERKRRLGGWFVAAVLVVGVIVVAVFVGKPYLARSQADANSEAKLDPRVLKFLLDGEKGLVEGNLDVARENFDKASALADQHPRVLLDAARYTSLVADIAWLRVKLVRDESSDEARLAKQSLDDLSARARSSAEASVKASSDEPKSVRVKVDALRIAGDRDGARALVPRLNAIAAEPETVYSLAALDLAEASPPWASIVDRLRIAAAGEGNLGRARAALVYSLAKAGDGAAAKSELARLEALPRAHVLLPSLRVLAELAVRNGGAVADAGTADASRRDAATPPTVDITSLPNSGQGAAQANPGNAGGGTPSANAGGATSNDPRVLNAQADQASKKGDYDRAKSLFESSVAINPNDSEALTGLGDIARTRRDSLGAQGFYRRALATNPSYLPAMVGLADTQWDLGDHGTAQKTYREIVDRFPEGTYPPRAKQRIEAVKPGIEPGSAPVPSAAPTASVPNPVLDSPPSMVQ